MTETELAYLAGIIDGEGSIAVYEVQDKNRRRTSFNTSVSVRTTTPELVAWITARFGGALRTDKANPERNAVGHRWQLVGRREIVDLLTAVLPFLVLKKPHAQLMIHYLGLPSPAGLGRGFSEVERNVRSAYCTLFRELNSTGPKSLKLKKEAASITMKLVASGYQK